MGCQNMYIYQLDDNIYPPLFQMGFLLLLLMFGSALAAPDKSEKAQVRLRGLIKDISKVNIQLAPDPSLYATIYVWSTCYALDFICFEFDALNFLLFSKFS